RLPANVDRVVGQLRDRAVIVVALDVVEQVEPIAKDHVPGDPDPPHSRQNVGPDRAVVLLVSCLNARLEPCVQADLHQTELPAASCAFSQRSPLAMCAVAAARASSGSPAAIAS